MRRAAAALALASLTGGCTVGADTPQLPPGRAVLATPTVDPPVHLFGDIVTAQLDVVVDERRLDPERVKLVPRFAPYEVVTGSTARERTDHGHISEIRYTMQLRCLKQSCIPQRLASNAGPDEPGRGERRAFRFRASALMYDEGERDRLLRAVRFPPVESVSRINESAFQLTRFPFVAGYRPLPEVTWFVSPPLLAGLLVVAALLLLTPGALLLRRWWRDRRPELVEEEPELPPLERALLLVLWSRDQPDGEDRRRALELLAETLDDEGPGDLANDARVLAWSPSSPSPNAATALVDRVRERANGHPG